LLEEIGSGYFTAPATAAGILRVIAEKKRIAGRDRAEPSVCCPAFTST
jgi:hypothetical protein